MANYIATDTQFNATADAIRAKTGSNAAIEWDEDTGFADDIAAISAGVDVSGVTATPADVLSPKVFVDENGDEQTGTIVTKSSSDLTASGATVSVPAGYYPTAASKSVTSGSAGTPTATKGTVSNNQVTVTPAVTNTTGYITGGTKTGTAVTVKASELVSGTKTISGSGSTDVTNYASASVAAGSATPPASISGSSATVTTGTNTLTLTKKISVTPTVSAGYVASGTAGDSTVSLTASVAINDSDDITASGATVSVPAGYYPEGASKSVSSGTAGTPTASKGTVTDHSVSVTPSVTNTAGYISGGTKSGTAVTVSASELVSGNKSITGSGSTDVTNYATASVAAGSAATPADSITSNPTITVSDSGLITASHSGSKSVTPTVSAGYVSSGTAGTVSTSGSNTKQLPTIPEDNVFPEKDTVSYSPLYMAWTFNAGNYLKRNIYIPRIQLSASKDNIKYGSSVGMLEDGEPYDPSFLSGTFTKASTVSSGQTAAGAGQILSGYSAWVDGAEVKGNIATKAAATITPGTSNQTIAAGIYLTGTQTIEGDSNLAAGNIKSGVSIFGVEGSYEGDSGTPKDIKVIPITSSPDITVGYRWPGNGSTPTVDAKYARTPRLATSNRKALMLDNTDYEYQVFMYKTTSTSAKPYHAYNNMVAGTILIIDPAYPAMTINIKRVDGADIQSSENSVIKSALHFYNVATIE